MSTAVTPHMCTVDGQYRWYVLLGYTKTQLCYVFVLSFLAVMVQNVVKVESVLMAFVTKTAAI